MRAEQEQRKAERMQKEIVMQMANILISAEEQQKRSSDLTLHTLKKISELIQKG